MSAYCHATAVAFAFSNDWVVTCSMVMTETPLCLVNVDTSIGESVSNMRSIDLRKATRAQQSPF